MTPPFVEISSKIEKGIPEAAATLNRVIFSEGEAEGKVMMMTSVLYKSFNTILQLNQGLDSNVAMARTQGI